MTKTVVRPVDQATGSAATDDFYRAHPEMAPNGIRKKIVNPRHREEWVAFYEKRGGKVTTVQPVKALKQANQGFAHAPLGSATQTCPLPKRSSKQGSSSPRQSASAPVPAPPPPSKNLRQSTSSPSGTPTGHRTGNRTGNKPICDVQQVSLTCSHGRQADVDGKLMVVSSSSKAAGDQIQCAMTLTGGCGQHPGWDIGGFWTSQSKGASTEFLARTWLAEVRGSMELQNVTPQVYQVTAGGCTGKGRVFQVSAYPPGKVAFKLDFGPLFAWIDWIKGKLPTKAPEPEDWEADSKSLGMAREYSGGWVEDKATWRAFYEQTVTIGFDPLWEIAVKGEVIAVLLPPWVAKWLRSGLFVEIKGGAKLQYASKSQYWPDTKKTDVVERSLVGGGGGSLALSLELKLTDYTVAEAAVSGEASFSLEAVLAKGDDAEFKLEFKVNPLKGKASIKLAWGWVELSHEFQLMDEWAPDPFVYKLT